MDHSKMEHAGHFGHAGQPGHDGHDGHSGHDHHAMMIADFRRRFWVVLALTLPVMGLSPMIQHWPGIELAFPGSEYVLAGLASVVFAYGGWPFLKGWTRR
jgi:Cu2+-exporting ATPase